MAQVAMKVTGSHVHWKAIMSQKWCKTEMLLPQISTQSCCQITFLLTSISGRSFVHDFSHDTALTLGELLTFIDTRPVK